MANPMTQTILNRMELAPGHEVYWIGRKATRLTFLSQQQRALNLIWALSSEGRLPPKSRIAVVGAGLAGLTAAFAAHKLGVQVTVFESKSVALHLQRGSELRFIHPNILDWPTTGSEALLTDLPCMNWGADKASRVSNTVLEEWISIEHQLTVNYGCEVRTIDKNEDGKYNLLAEGKVQNVMKPFDLVILAVGFGLERPLPGLPLLSYWENDNYGRPIVMGALPRSYLVTGCGDGGLIDAIRLRINAFDHGNFVFSLQRLPDIELIKERLPQIDREVQLELTAMARESDPKKEDEGVLLERKYRQLEIPASLRDLITNQLREDTIVYLNSPNRTPYSLKASALNRFLVFLLREYGGIRYRAGNVAVTVHAPTHGFGVACQHPEFPVESFHVHEVVVRHGPIPIIDKLFPKNVAEACRGTIAEVDDPTRHAMYPNDFLALPELLERKRKVAFDYLLCNAALATMGHFNARLHSRFGVETQPDRIPPVRYFISPHSEGGAAAIHAAHFYEFPIVVDPAAPAPLASRKPKGKTNTKVKTKSKPTMSQSADCLRTVHIGIGIAIADQSGIRSIGTLGCLVRVRASGEVALLTAGHVLNPSESVASKSAVYCIAGIGSKINSPPIAQVTRIISPVASAPRATFAAGNVILNEIDAGIAVLLPGIEWDPRVRAREGYLSLKPFNSDDSTLLGKRVFKVGIGSEITFGLVEQIGVVFNTGGIEGSTVYRGLFCVKGIDERPFCAPGDGGALVMCEDGTALGMLLFGNDQYGWVSPIRTILSALECDLILSRD